MKVEEKLLICPVNNSEQNMSLVQIQSIVLKKKERGERLALQRNAVL